MNAQLIKKNNRRFEWNISKPITNPKPITNQFDRIRETVLNNASSFQ